MMIQRNVETVFPQSDLGRFAADKYEKMVKSRKAFISRTETTFNISIKESYTTSIGEQFESKDKEDK